MTRLELKSSTTTSNVRGGGGEGGGTQGGHNLPPPVPLTFLSLCLPTPATFKDRKPRFSVKAVG